MGLLLEALLFLFFFFMVERRFTRTLLGDSVELSPGW